MNRLLSRHLAWPISEWLCGRDTWSRLRSLRRTQSLDRSDMRDLQTIKLQRLLKYAADHCPFYRNRLLAAGFNVNDLNLKLSDLRHLPILTRDEIREHAQEMLSTAPAARPIPYSTGGSSGEPLQLFIDSHRAAADWAARWRAREWWNLRPGDCEVMLWGGASQPSMRDSLKSWRDHMLNQHVLSAFDLSPESMNRYVRRIRDLKPVCAYGYASSLALLARYALDEFAGTAPLASRRLRAVFATGEVLTPADAGVIAQAFDAPVVGEYGCRDGGLLGCACPHGSLHVPQENVIVEVVDEEGRPVAPGRPGDVVITYLETFAMPVIRYRNGDVAVAGESPCRCGRPSQVLKQIRGRRTDHVVCRRDGKLVTMHALALIYVIREVEGVRQFRIHQPDLHNLQVDIVAGAALTQESERRIISGLLERMGPEVQIELRRRESIPPLASGKHVCVTSDVKRTLAEVDSIPEAGSTESAIDSEKHQLESVS